MPVKEVVKVRTFVETAWWRRKAGGGEHEWELIPNSDKLPAQRAVSADQQANDWIAANDVQVLSVSAPGIHKHLARENTLLCVTMAISVLFKAKVDAPTQSPAE